MNWAGSIMGTVRHKQASHKIQERLNLFNAILAVGNAYSTITFSCYYILNFYQSTSPAFPLSLPPPGARTYYPGYQQILCFCTRL